MTCELTRGIGRKLAAVVGAALATGLAATATVGATGAADSMSPGTTDVASAADPLAPRPLAEQVTLRVNLPALIDTFSAFLVADALGEFEKENIEIEILTLPSADAAPQLADGDIDVMGRGLDAGYFNARGAGFEMKFVYPNGAPSPHDKTGWWFTTDVAEGGPEALEGALLGSSVGVGSPVSLLLYQHLQEAGLDLTDVEFQVLPAADLTTALANGAVDGAFLSAPFWTTIDGQGVAELALPLTIVNGGYIFGDRLLNEDREIGEAFVRALARAERDHLQGDYLDDPVVLSALAEIMQRDEDELAKSEVAVFPEAALDWADTIGDLQTAWFEVDDVLTYDEPLSFEEVVDTSFLEGLDAG